ncbi:hypothetical protein [Noviherbaspirillum sp.]|uniref:hypothetical protein n=1 Tax=Noviherbaspirillum sp. TaxID=1926288 RepID=UPI0039C910A0
MAANAAASVVWLTAMTLLSDLGSAFAATFVGLLAVFESGFLVVTGAFNFSGAAGFAAARDEVFAFGAAAAEAILDAALATVFVVALFEVFALLAGLAAAVFFTAGFAIDLAEAILVAADFAFFAVTVVFAGFFIAFAMESIPTGLLSCAE